MPDKNTLYCSFCGKSQGEAKKLIAGPTAFICDECVVLCLDIIKKERQLQTGQKVDRIKVAVAQDPIEALDTSVNILRTEIAERTERADRFELSLQEDRETIAYLQTVHDLLVSLQAISQDAPVPESVPLES